MIMLYGITNCDTVRKARKWLQENNVEYEFWDYKKRGIDEAHLRKWCQEFGWERVLNRKGMMWRRAAEADKAKVTDEDSAIEFMLDIPTSIKRPIVETENGLLIGLDNDEWEGRIK